MLLTSLDTKILRHLAAVDEACADELACVARADPPATAAACRHLAAHDVVRQASASVTAFVTGGELRAATWAITTAGRWVLRGLDETKANVDEHRRNHPSVAGGDVA